MEYTNTPDLGGGHSKMVSVFKTISVVLVVVSAIAMLFLSSVPQELIKISLFSFTLVILSVFLFFLFLKTKKIFIPRSFTFYSLGLVVVVSAISSLFSGNIAKSFIGYGFEFGTSGFLLGLFILIVILFQFFRQTSGVGTTYNLLAWLGLAFIIFHLVSSFNGVFGNSTLNLAGGWDNVAVISGLICLISAVRLKSYDLLFKHKMFLYVLFILSFILQVKVGLNETSMWIVTAIMSIILAVVFMSGSFGQEDHSDQGVLAKISVPVLIMVLVSIVCILFPSKILSTSSKFFSSDYSSPVYSTWKISYESAKSIIKGDPLLGPGPNLYFEKFLKNKPDQANRLATWNMDYIYSKGSIPTLMVSTGILGIIVWLMFLISIISVSLRSFSLALSHGNQANSILWSGIAVLFLSVMLTLNVLGVAVFLILVILLTIHMSLFLSAQSLDGEVVLGSNESGFIKNSAIVLVILILVLSIFYSWKMGVKFVAAYEFHLADVAVKTGNFDLAVKKIEKAGFLSNDDIYYQVMANLWSGKLNSLILNPDTKNPDFSKVFSTTFENTINSAKIAIQKNPNNYQNYVILGQLASKSVSFEAEGAYQAAKEAYRRAIDLAPKNPSIYMYLARLEYSKNNSLEAKTLLSKSLELKPDLVEASLALSNIFETEKNHEKAISVLVSTAEALVPQVDFNLYLTLGTLLYNQKKYSEAVSILNKIVQIDPQHSDARYFIGLSLANLGDKNGALSQFEEIKKYNPDVTELNTIISNISSGRDPLNGVRWLER